MKLSPDVLRKHNGEGAKKNDWEITPSTSYLEFLLRRSSEKVGTLTLIAK
ncbi:hypothetical protein ACRRTK_009128 [Alexandromys fortis]